jgi:CheY-like chemotaxis protein/two-component sensor histidine kinase
LIRLNDDTRFAREHEIIERQARHLVRLVDDLMDVARIVRGKVDLEKQACDLREVIESAIEMAERAIERNRHRLTVEVPESTAWWGDPQRLAQVVANLLTNAARYTEPGGDIRITAALAGEVISIEVADTGVGIGEDMLQSIFDLFVQGGRRPMNRAEGGLGLGLSLAKNLVELHGGSIAAFSDGLGRGSRFVVTLPAARTPTVRPPRAVAAKGVTKRILVVDDNVDAAEMICELLRGEGHDVAMAHDGLSALKLCERFRPEVAVLDIGLPVMDGYELAGRITAALPDRDCRLIALTGYAQREDRQRSSAAGFHEHLVKPVNFERLSRAVAGVVKGTGSAG